MNDQTKVLKGSPSRDEFKRLHKKLSPQFYACDIDFVFVEKEPTADIVLAVDYKAEGDAITFSETIAYNSLIRRGIDVYIVKGDVDTGCFQISQYVGGHYGRPRADLLQVASTQSWEEFGEWERQKRNEWKQRFRP